MTGFAVTYILIWLAFVGFVARLELRQVQLARSLEALRRQLAERAGAAPRVKDSEHRLSHARPEPDRPHRVSSSLVQTDPLGDGHGR